MADDSKDEFIVRPHPDPDAPSCGPDPALDRVKDLVDKDKSPLTEDQANAVMAKLASTLDGTNMTTGGMLRYNSGKLRMSLVPASLGRYTAAVLAYGAIKYSANNWRKGGSWSEIYESLQRHIDSFREGEDLDPESGLPHLSHAAFNLMVLIEFFDKGLGNDDRFRYDQQPAGALLPGRVLEFRQPPVQPDPAPAAGAAAGDAGGADASAG